MLPIARALKSLEEQTGFSHSFIRATERSDNWPNQWMTAEQINDELTARGFWSRDRRSVHPNARIRLVTHYIDEQMLKSMHLGGPGGWQRFDGQYKLNPQSKLINDPTKRRRTSTDQRVEARSDVAGVTCQYGPILDMSRTGVRFRSDREADFLAGQKGFIRLTCGKLTVRTSVKVLWMKDGVEGLSVGCDFRRIDEEQQLLINKILATGIDLLGDSQAA